MFSRFKEVFNNAVTSIDPLTTNTDHQSLSPSSLSTVHRSQSSHSSFSTSGSRQCPPAKYRYSRPHFLNLNGEDEIQVTADHSIRPIIVPRSLNSLPWNSGYAECINAGKSIRNEDQAAFFTSTLRVPVSSQGKDLEAKIIDLMSPLAAALNGNVHNLNKHHVKQQTNKRSQSMSTIFEPSSSDAAAVNGITTNIINNDGDHGNDLTTTIKGEEEVSESKEVVVEELETNVVDTLDIPWTYFGMFDGHAGPGVAVAAANQLHLIIQRKLEQVSDLLLFFHDKEQQQLDSSEIEKSSKSDQEPMVNGSVDKKKQFLDPLNHIINNCSNGTMITVDTLIKGCLESSFWEMDQQIEKEKSLFSKMAGGCTAIAAIFIFGKVYVANAGDSRAVLVTRTMSKCSDQVIEPEVEQECRKKSSWKVKPMSFDFTPESESERVKLLAMVKPELLGQTFTRLEFVRRPTRRDLGCQLLVRDAGMTGWTLKTITHNDLKFPLIFGSGKRSRVLGTIGVTRGFGDHELRAQFSEVLIKPFLTPQPEVQIIDVVKKKDQSQEPEEGVERVLVMGTDGLWDVSSNERVAAVVCSALEQCNGSRTGKGNEETLQKYRFISAAQDLVMASRGKLRLPTTDTIGGGRRNGGGQGWRTSGPVSSGTGTGSRNETVGSVEKSATIDDISVFVIPLEQFERESIEWIESRKKRKQK